MSTCLTEQMEAEFSINGSGLRLVVTHFGLAARERTQQLEQISGLLMGGQPEICLLIGDLNEWRPSSGFERRLRKMFGSTLRRRTFPSRRPALALDRILANPAAAISGLRAVKNPMTALASDHLPLVADLALKRPSNNEQGER